FNGGQLLNLAVAACISNDMFREAAREGIALRRVRVTAASEYAGSPMVSSAIGYDIEVDGHATDDRLRALVERVDRIAESPHSLRGGTEVRLTGVRVTGGA